MNLSQCRDSDTYLLSFDYPPIQACVSYLSVMILLFLDLQGALFHSPPIVEDHSEVHSSPEAFWAYVSPLSVLRPVSVQVENFFAHKWGIEPAPMAVNQNQ
jgi:hypothetical protein